MKLKMKEHGAALADGLAASLALNYGYCRVPGCGSKRMQLQV